MQKIARLISDVMPVKDMRNILKVIVIVYIVASAILIGYYLFGPNLNGRYKVVNLISDATPDQMKLFKKMGTDWLKEAKLYSINEYKLAIPNKPSDTTKNAMYLWKNEDLFLTSVDGIGTQVYNPGTQFDISKYIVNLQDWDNNGEYDFIAYTIVDNKNELKTEIIDRNLDGNLDYKTETTPNDYKFFNSLGTKWELQESQ